MFSLGFDRCSDRFADRSVVRSRARVWMTRMTRAPRSRQTARRADTTGRRSPRRRVDGRRRDSRPARRSRSRASRPATRTRCSASSAAISSRCCAGRRARRCRRPRTTWRASSACCSALHDPAGWHAQRAGAGARADRVLHRRRRDRRAVLLDASRRRCRRARVAAAGARGRSRSGARRARSRWSTRSPASTGSTGAPAGSTASAGPTATSNARCRAGSASSRATRRAPLPEVDEAGEWLSARVPPAQPPGVIHGDYKLDNVMLAPQPAGRARRRRRLGAVDDR